MTDHETPYPETVIGRFACPQCGKQHAPPDTPHVYRDQVFGSLDCADLARAEMLYARD